MTIEELKRQEFDSFMDDFKELISKHKESLLALKMGICFERYHIVVPIIRKTSMQFLQVEQ